MPSLRPHLRPGLTNQGLQLPSSAWWPEMRQTLNLAVMRSCGDRRGTLGRPNACARGQGDGGSCRKQELQEDFCGHALLVLKVEVL
jgi:hypothetical protein